MEDEAIILDDHEALVLLDYASNDGGPAGYPSPAQTKLIELGLIVKVENPAAESRVAGYGNIVVTRLGQAYVAVHGRDAL